MTMMKKLQDGMEVELNDAGEIVRMRVPIFACDSLQRAVAAASTPEGTYERYCADHAAELARYAELGAQLSGPPVRDTAQLEAAEQTRAAYIARLTDAWRMPGTGAPNPETREAEIQERRKHETELIAEKQRQAAQTAEERGREARVAIERARAERNRRLSETWKAA